MSHPDKFLAIKNLWNRVRKLFYCNIYFFCKKRFILFSCFGMFNFSTESYSRCFQIKHKQMLLPNTHGNFQPGAATDVEIQRGILHFITSAHLLHLTFAAETAVFLVACLAFLASFAALLIHRKSVTFNPSLPFTHSLSLHCSELPKVKKGMHYFRFILCIQYPLGRLLQKQKNCMWQKWHFHKGRGHEEPSQLLLSLGEITQYYLQIHWY